MIDTMERELDIEQYVSEFETAIAILEYYQKCELISTYYMENGQTASAPQPQGQTQPQAQTVVASNPNVPANIQPVPGQTVPSPQPGAPTTAPATTSAPTTAPAKTASQILAGQGADVQKKQNIFKRLADAIKKIWNNIVTFFTGKKAQESLEVATQVVEEAKSSGMSAEEFSQQVISWAKASGGSMFQGVPDATGGANTSVTSNGTAGGTTAQPQQITMDQLTNFYSVWFETGKVPGFLSVETIEAMNKLERLLLTIAKTIPTLNAQQITQRCPALLKEIDARSADVLNEMNKHWKDQQSMRLGAVVKTVFQDHIFEAGKLTKKMQAAFDQFQNALAAAMSDPEKGTAINQVFGNISGPMKNIMIAATALNNRMKVFEIATNDRKAAQVKGAISGNVGGSKQKLLNVGEKKKTINFQLNKMRAEMEEKGMSENEIKKALSAARPVMDSEYDKQYNDALEASTKAHTVGGKKPEKKPKTSSKKSPSKPKKNGKKTNQDVADYRELYT